MCGPNFGRTSLQKFAHISAFSILCKKLCGNGTDPKNDRGVPPQNISHKCPFLWEIYRLFESKPAFTNDFEKIRFLAWKDARLTVEYPSPCIWRGVKNDLKVYFGAYREPNAFYRIEKPFFVFMIFWFEVSKIWGFMWKIQNF